MPIKKIVIGVTIFILLIIILQNLTMVDVNVLFWAFGVNLLLVILLPLLIGIAIGWFLRTLFEKKPPEKISKQDKPVQSPL